MSSTLTRQWAPVGRRDFLMLYGADPTTGVGLEIGAANSPIIPRHVGDCRYIDYASTADLRARFAASDYAYTHSVVDVDYVWPGSGSLAVIVGDQRFDYAMASHVIEHVPNPLGWFRGIIEVLKPGGVFNLAIPDKRFTFDIDCPLSSVGELVEAHLLGYVKPSPRQIFDSCYYGKAVDPGAPWLRHIERISLQAFSGELSNQLAFDQAARSLEGTYYDAHCWAFTPHSFLELLRGVCDLRLFDYLLSDFHPTVEGEFEFHLNLTKPPEDMDRDTIRAHQLQRIEYFLQALNERDRKLRLLVE